MDEKTLQNLLVKYIEIFKKKQAEKELLPQEEAWWSNLEQDEELKSILEYKRLELKKINGEELTPEELVWKTNLEDQIKKEKEAEKQKAYVEEEQKRQEKENKVKEKVMQEYKKTKQNNPDEIIQVRREDVSLTGGTSIPKLLSFIVKMKRAKKKGGKVLVQVFRDRKVSIKWTLNDVKFVEFLSTDENGNTLEEVTRFSEYNYNFEGTPIPVLFAVQGYAEGFDFFSEFRKDLTSEMVSRLVMRGFHAGYLKGIEHKSKKDKANPFASLEPWMPIIIIGGFFVMAYILYTMYGEFTQMVELMQQMQGQINALKEAAAVQVIK
jgi:hypothetical protein